MAVPLISSGVTARMSELDPSAGRDRCDNVLVEWILALELHAAGRIKAISLSSSERSSRMAQCPTFSATARWGI